MGAISEALKHMMKAGMSQQDIIAAVADMENAGPPMTKRQERNKRYYEKKASEKRLKASYSDEKRLNSDGMSSPSLAPLFPPSSPAPFLPPLIPPLSSPPHKTRVRVKLDDLSVDHIREWLQSKRAEGKYLLHDEYEILEGFKDYCKSKGRRYDDYIAAYRNAFKWEQFTPKLSKFQRSREALLKGLTEDGGY